VEREDGEQRSLPASADRDRPALLDDIEGAEKVNFHSDLLKGEGTTRCK